MWQNLSKQLKSVIDLAAPALLGGGVLGAWRVGQLVRARAAAAAPALGLHSHREFFERGGDLAARGEAIFVVEARAGAGSGAGVHEAAAACTLPLRLRLRPGGGNGDAARRAEGQRPLVTSRVGGGGGAPEGEGRLLLDDGGGVADGERADAAGQLLVVGGVGRRRRRLGRWLLQWLQEVVRPEEETLSRRRRRRLGIGARELRQRQRRVLARRGVEREEVVGRLIPLEPHDHALHLAGRRAIEREDGR